MLGIDFCDVRKDGEGGYQTIEESFFSFYQKLRMEKPDSKLLKMLLHVFEWVPLTVT
jgi:hypothetical protein